jgi:hypothetical protein
LHTFLVFYQCRLLLAVQKVANGVGLPLCRWEKGRKYVAVVCCFAGFLYCNVKALQVSTLACLNEQPHAET